MKNNLNDEMENNNIVPIYSFINENAENVKDGIDPTLNFSDNEDILPTALLTYRSRQLRASLLIAGVSLFFSIFLKHAGPLVLLMGSAYLIYQALTVGKRFESGEIVEAGVVCTGLSVSSIRDRVNVTFRSVDEDSSGYFKFTVPGRSAQDDFIPDAPYVIYFDRNNPHSLISYVQV